MRHLFLLLPFFIVLLLFSCEQADPSATVDQVEATTATAVPYDSIKAKEFGADDYGMKKYVMAFLKKGPNRDLDATKAAELQNAHMKNITRMAEEGKLVLAGPFFGDGELRGIYVFNVPTIAEAEQLTNTDPAIQAGSLEMELIEWYGSAALMAINDMHITLTKKDIVE